MNLNDVFNPQSIIIDRENFMLKFFKNLTKNVTKNE